jgi:capsular polysaccharide biosynthesis protein
MNDTAAPADADTAARHPAAPVAAPEPHGPGRPRAAREGSGPGRAVRALRRAPHWVPLPLGIALGLACGLGYGLAATPQYTATAYVMVVPTRTGDPAAALGFAQAYGRIVTGSAVLAGAQRAADASAADLRGRVRSATSPDAPMISVTGTGTRGTGAAHVANAVADSLARTGNATSASTGVRLLVFARATAPTAPTSPSAPLSAAVGAAAGGLLGGFVLFVRPGRERGWEPEPEWEPGPRPGAEPAPGEAAAEAQEAGAQEAEAQGGVGGTPTVPAPAAPAAAAAEPRRAPR